MISRWSQWSPWGMLLGTTLVVAVVVAALYFPGLRQRMREAAQIKQKSAEQARQELLTPAGNPGEPRVKAKMFWAANGEDGTLAPVVIDLPLSSDPVLRSKQVLSTLLAGPVEPELRTLPPDVVLLAFYILPDGTAIGDFSEALATSLPSGIQSEQLAVDSIARTLEANVPQIQRLKILIHGQELDSLAGHVDLTVLFPVNSKAAARTDVPATGASTVAPAKLTPNATPGKLTTSPQPKR
jgi:spore germination protein GerM